jgi:ABC-type phosphate/phosphonate transport system substrate-binding protein
MRSFATAAVVAFCTLGHLSHAAAPDRQPPLKIGIVKTLLRGMSENLIRATLRPFGLLAEAQTGLQVELSAEPGGVELARSLESGEVDLGIFQGIEFAWARSRDPNLRPLMLAQYGSPELGACLIVRSDSKPKSMESMAGSSLAMPIDSRLHCHLYLERLVAGAGGRDPKHFFKVVHMSANAEEALDDVIDGSQQAALVDRVAWACYQRLKPSRATELKVIGESESFPASVVVFRAGRLPSETLERVQKGMLNAEKQALGRQLLTLWKLTGFAEVPRGYLPLADSIIRIYPWTGSLPATYPDPGVQVGSGKCRDTCSVVNHLTRRTPHAK